MQFGRVTFEDKTDGINAMVMANSGVSNIQGGLSDHAQGFNLRRLNALKRGLGLRASHTFQKCITLFLQESRGSSRILAKCSSRDG